MSLVQTLVHALEGLPPWFVILLISMLPFIELRGSLPVALLVYHLPLPEAYGLAVVGNLLPVPVILAFLGPVERFLRRWPRWDRFFTWLFDRTHSRASERVQRYETLALVLFVAVPAPATGAWTGALAAYLFSLDRRWSLLAIAAGVLLAGLAVALVVVTGTALWVLG